jgi:hypothetical protein
MVRAQAPARLFLGFPPWDVERSGLAVNAE